MPVPAPPALTRTRLWRITIAAMVACLLTLAGVLATSTPAHAASQGTGFGTWAPISPYGWHGSMLIGGVHTYCILPGAPAPTGSSVDNGVSGSAAGLSPRQLTGINLLVTKYGQTDDPVQAAAVGWAVKAMANWNETLHHFGYRGDSLTGAIDWTFSALAPAQNESVQRLAVAYYEEAMSTPTGVSGGSGVLTFSTDAADPRRGSVRTDASTAAAIGTITLVNATFVDTGTTVMAGAVPGREYEIKAQPPAPGRPFSVSGSGRFSVLSIAAVRHFTTPDGQDTAGPATEVTFDVGGSDVAARVLPFAPTITTQVTARYADGAPFVDDVSFAGLLEEWPRADDGGYLPVAASATVYRTDDEPVLTDGTVPTTAIAVGSLSLSTDPQNGPLDPYRVTSTWPLPGPGFYTAVWTVRRDAQRPEVAASLAADYGWTESFGERSQIVMAPAVSSRALATVTVGEPLTDTIIVGAPLPSDGLDISSALYRARQGVEPAEVCKPENLVWSSEVHRMNAPGEHSVVGPAVQDSGTYFWQERAVDADGVLVHVGVCGAASETTQVVDATIPTPALAATGLSIDSTHTLGGFAVGLLTLGTTFLTLSRRRRPASQRYSAPSPIG